MPRDHRSGPDRDPTRYRPPRAARADAARADAARADDAHADDARTGAAHADAVHAGAEALLDSSDQSLLARLARLWTAHDPVPPSLVPGVTFAVALDEVYAEVAEIQRQGHRPLAGVRGSTEAEAPSMSFSTSDLSMTLMVTPLPRERLRLDGWVTPTDVAAVVLRLPGETRRHDTRGGRFWFDDVPRGHVQLLVEDDAGALTMVTPAVEL